MKWAFLIALFAASVCNGEGAGPDFVHIDRDVALAYGMAVVKESYKLRRHGTVFVSMDELDLTGGTVHEMTDGTNRTFAMVAFRSKHDRNAGYYVVLEFCSGRLGEYTPSYSSSTLNLSRDEMSFLSVENDPTADFPGDCTHGL